MQEEELSIEQIDKIGNTIIYLSTRVGELARTKLLKLLFLIEEKSIKDFGKPFFSLDFKVWQFGPVVEPIYNEITVGQMYIFKHYFTRNIFDEFVAVKEFSDNEFSNNEILLLDKMVDFARHKIAKDFVRITHAPDSLWTKTAKKHGVFEDLEFGGLTKTNFSIEFSLLFEDCQDSFVFERYKQSIENNLFSRNFKVLKGV